MSTSTATSSCGRERRLPSTSALSDLVFSDDIPHHYHDIIPLSYVHFPADQHGSSSSTSEISAITRLAHAAAATHGSPPTSMGAVSYSSIFSSNMDDPPMTVGTAGNPTTSTFRLEPKFGPNTKLRSNVPFWSSSITNNTSSIRGRKRTAHSMTLNNSNSAAITRNEIASRTQRRSHQDNQLQHHPPSTGRNNHYAMTPPSPRPVDAAVFNLQGLSLQSPASTTSGIYYHNATDFRSTTNTTTGTYIASPAATQSSFTACGSSSFSKVNTSFTSATATVDGASPFRNYRCGSFGSTVEYHHQVGGINESMPPPASIEITSSSPRIVPLTVLTHDSLPTTQTLKVTSANCQRRNLSFGSSVAEGQPPLQHVVFAMGISPIHHSVGSSTTSEDCPSSAGRTTLHTMSGKMNDIFRDNHLLTTRTPQRLIPPITSVQYCPDSTQTAMSILDDSPVTSFAAHKSTPSILTMRQGNHHSLIPKVLLTPRSGIISGLPSFPSPSSTGDDDRHDSTIVLPKTISSHVNISLRSQQPTTPALLDVSLLSETLHENESCSLEVSIDHISVMKPNAFKSCRTKTNLDASPALPKRDACISDKIKESEHLNLTMNSTPSEVSNVSLQEMIIEMGTNHLTVDSHRNVEVDTESLSDGDDDEFFLAIPSTLAEKQRDESEGALVRQSKQPRLHHTDISPPVVNGNNPICNQASMASFGSFNTLLGTRYAMSNTSLRGMDASSNQFTMTSNNTIPTGNQQHASTECITGTTGSSTIERVGSMTSIGLDLDNTTMEKTNVFGRVRFDGGRDLITPPIMLEVFEPPILSPRFASKKK